MSNPSPESESLPLSPSPSPIESSPPSPSPSPKKKSSPSHKSSIPHIRYFFIFQNMKTNKIFFPPSFTNRVENVQYGTAAKNNYLDSGVTRPESRDTISESESESESKLKNLDSIPSHQKMDSSPGSCPSPYSSHTALICKGK